MCRQEMEGSGFPVAKQVRVTLVPSLMVMSWEMSYIFGGTGMARHTLVSKAHIHLGVYEYIYILLSYILLNYDIMQQTEELRYILILCYILC